MKAACRDPSVGLFADDIIYRFPGLKGGRLWKAEHDLQLLQAVMKYVFNLHLFIS